MYPHDQTLEQYARTVWTAALRGRQNARAGDFKQAYTYMDGLAQVATALGKAPESLRTIALSAAIDIHRMLNNGAVPIPHGGGSAA